MALSVADGLAAIVRAPAFLAKYPYYAAVLARLRAVADPSVERMAVALDQGQFYLHVNVERFVDGPQYITGVLLHEVHHIALGHLSDARYRAVTEPELMELALEMSANEYIAEPLPDPIVWRAFAAFGIRAGQSTLERYDALCAARAAGRAVARAGGALDDHGPWQRAPPPPGASAHAARLVEEALAAVERERDGREHLAPKLAGRDPGAVLEALRGAYGPPRTYVDWRATLRAFVSRARAPVHTYARPSRRFPHRVGELPGRAYAPRSASRPHVLVAIDTSASMSTEALHEVARQLAALGAHARITVAECDAAIARVYAFSGALESVSGRGGTDLRPVFATEFLRSIRPDGVVYFTDGNGPFPPLAPPVPALWVLTADAPFACPWGERVALR